MATCLVRTLLPVVTKVKFHRNVLKNPPKLACTKLDTHKPQASQTFNFVSQLCTFAKVCKTGSVIYDEVVEIQEECNPVMIDVRDRHEVEQSGPVPGTINIPPIIHLSTNMAGSPGGGAKCKDLDYEDIINLTRRNEIILIDVREPSEINETGKLPGSIHIPLGELKNALEVLCAEEWRKKYGIEKPKNDANLVFSCRSGRRSRSAMETAMAIGYLNSRHYSGGFLDWQKHHPSTAAK